MSREQCQRRLKNKGDLCALLGNQDHAIIRFRRQRRRAAAIKKLSSEFCVLGGGRAFLDHPRQAERHLARPHACGAPCRGAPQLHARQAQPAFAREAHRRAARPPAAAAAYHQHQLERRSFPVSRAHRAAGTPVELEVCLVDRPDGPRHGENDDRSPCRARGTRRPLASVAVCFDDISFRNHPPSRAPASNSQLAHSDARFRTSESLFYWS